jgi:hypothetical protein
VTCDDEIASVSTLSVYKSSPSLSIRSSRLSHPSPKLSNRITSYNRSVNGHPPFSLLLSIFLLGYAEGVNPGRYVDSFKVGVGVLVGLEEKEGNSDDVGKLDIVGYRDGGGVGILVGPVDGEKVGCVGRDVIVGVEVGREVVLVRKGSLSWNTFPVSSLLNSISRTSCLDIIEVHVRYPLTRYDIAAIRSRRIIVLLRKSLI